LAKIGKTKFRQKLTFKKGGGKERQLKKRKKQKKKQRVVGVVERGFLEILFSGDRTRSSLLLLSSLPECLNQRSGYFLFLLLSLLCS
jgi:hypothetical protein